MNRKTAYALVLILVTATGAWLLKISTPHGLGLTDDAISYIAASRALLAGQGFTRIWLRTGLEPIIHWPPGFPTTLALISLIFKIDPYRSARVLNVLIFGANAGILGLLGYKMTKSPRSKGFREAPLWGSPYFAGILLSILFLSNTALLRLHAQALSEPLYIFVSLLAFLAFYRVFSPPPIPTFPRGGKEQLSQTRHILPPSGGETEISRSDVHVLPSSEGVRGGKMWLLITGILTGISYLTRYAALSLIATFIVAIFILFPTWKKRFKSLAYFFAGLLPLILPWMLRNEVVGGTATNRRVIWHPVTLKNARRGLRSSFQFILPYFETPEYFILAIILVVFLIALLMWVLPRGIKYFLKPEKNTRPKILPFVTVLYIFSYLGSLLVSLSFFDAATPLNDRILSPVYVSILIMLIYLMHKLYEEGKILPRILAISLTLFLLTTSFIANNRTVAELQESALGFASWRWRESTVMEAIRDLPDDVEIYTNQPPAVYFWTNRPAYLIWGSEQSDTVRSGDAVLAIFYPPHRDTPKFQAWLAEITEGLEPIQKSGLGNLYRKVE
ncbi:MAG TPA: hypothetical protein EYP74_04270 [Anaerolineales bacterium]|nr:hypothetical protein [Anaerolineales bacterium]